MPWRAVFFYGIVVLAPIIRGGNRPLALLVLESLAVILLLLLLLRPAFLSKIPLSQRLLILVIFILPLFYLIPMPFTVWEMLPGRADYGAAMKALSPQMAEVSMAASMDSDLTRYAWLALLPPVAVFLYAVQANAVQYQRIAVTFVVLAAAQALLGLMQYSAGAHSLLRLGWESGGRAIGTYASRDHLAGLLEMALPMSLAMLLAAISKIGFIEASGAGTRSLPAAVSGRRLYVSFGYGLLTLMIFLGLIFTQSRAGVALSMLIVFVAMFSYSFKLGGLNSYGIFGSLLSIAIGLALMVGLVPVLNRFAVDPLQDSRWSIFISSWEVIKAYFPVGSGFGTYKEVYQRFHALDLRGVFIHNAHNDYLELLVEGGLAVAVLLLCFLCLYVMQWRAVFKKRQWDRAHIIQAAAGIGLLALMLHSLVDFNLHIPANLIYFALLAGIFFNSTREYSPKITER